MISYPYIILILIIFFASLITLNKKSNSIYIVCCIVVFIFFSFRAPVVGADTYNYVRFFTGETNYYIVEQRELEPLLLFYNSIIQLFTHNGVAYLMINTIISFSPIYYLVEKYSLKKSLSIFLFFALGFYISYFVALRQILSISFFLWGVIAVYENRKNKWLIFSIFTIFSYFMHTTALISLIVYLSAYFVKIERKLSIYFSIILSVLIGFFSDSYSFVNIFSIIYSQDFSGIERISNYLVDDSVRDELPLNVLLRSTAISLFIVFFIDKRRVNDWFFKIYIFSVIIFNLLNQFPMIQRANLSFAIFSIIVFTWIYESVDNKKSYLIINIFVLTIMIYFLRAFIISTISPDMNSLNRMHPYYFFFENYSSHPSITRF